MQQKSYTKNYLKIYLWQGIAMILNFLSMFIVIPYLTSNPTTYGIYSICISFTMFLAYADFGFIGAGQKYAAEHFARGEKNEEMKVIGFTNFILLIFILLFSIVFFLLSFKPELLVKGLATANSRYVASSLLLILAVFTPTTLLQRLLQMIFGIRMEDYIIQRTTITASFLKIVSVLWFFRDGKYDIVGYFLFTQIVNFFAAIVTIFIAKKKYSYDFFGLLKAIHFDREVYNKTKGLAFASLFLTASWILYYELDSVSIGKFLGAEYVASYGIGLIILTFFRNIFGILFSPFSIRFNHFIGYGDEEKLNSFLLQVITIIAPIIVIPIITIAMFANPLILTWVGSDYYESIRIVQFLTFCNFFAFITYPVATYLMAKEHQKEMYFIASILPIVFWLGILITYSYWGIFSFAVFKLLAFIISAVVYYKLMLKFLGMNIAESLNKIFKPMLFPVLFILLSTYFIRDYLPVNKEKSSLLIVVGSAGCLICIAFVMQYFFSESWRSQMSKLMQSYKKV
ncbi:polysaccharide biosynthesis protein [Flavobacterium sp. DG1-102-2]|uniref:polysaccharide biosynthesis protein n=1 Tax=Flavobacterium sp. DG1-102-2 TaxID=3081663 RepID=UPI00294A0202|nr:polysaccharide biosynthesis protein [Flavobacterium sp. DG1-102-2]MDV6168384.1 polysaccharide biosynthesis protein [Flavobacterium sp. DG1-102-2]